MVRMKKVLDNLSTNRKFRFNTKALAASLIDVRDRLEAEVFHVLDTLEVLNDNMDDKESGYFGQNIQQTDDALNDIQQTSEYLVKKVLQQVNRVKGTSLSVCYYLGRDLKDEVHVE